MKRLEISRLMDEYTDTEFFPEGGSTANPEAVKGWVLANAKAPAQKKQMPRKKRVLLAAALAAVMVVLMGAGFPSVIYHLAGGTLGFMEDTTGRTISYQQNASLMELEDGRLYFVLDGERTDITDLIDGETPYIYDGSNPDENLVYYVILGGTPEHYGCFQWNTVPDPFAADPNYVSVANEDGIVYTYDFDLIGVSKYKFSCMGVGNPDWRMFSDFNKNAEFDIADYQWLRVAADELEIPFIDSTGESVTTIHE